MVFRAKYGRGDDLAGLMKEMYPKFSARMGIAAARLYTDVTGPMFSVITEVDFADGAAYAAASAHNPEMFADPEFQSWFARMAEVTESGETQLLNMERLA
jgi:hypothetical protein